MQSQNSFPYSVPTHVRSLQPPQPTDCSNSARLASVLASKASCLSHSILGRQLSHTLNGHSEAAFPELMQSQNNFPYSVPTHVRSLQPPQPTDCSNSARLASV